MKNLFISFITVSALSLHGPSVMAENNTIDTLLKSYQSQGAKLGNAQKGEKFWNKTFTGKAPFVERSCNTCHTANLKNAGKHVRTRKVLKPMAPSVNAASLTKTKKIEKWFKRNCKWTVGRECSAQEKADILTFIKQQ